MMIAHASIPADDPKLTAAVLAEILGGEAIRFPPGGPDAFMAWSGDGKIELEVVRRGRRISYKEAEGVWEMNNPEERASEVHLAICVDRPESEIIAIAKRAGWPARHCDRGGGIFSLVEVWVDGAFMIEFLDPKQTQVYLERVTVANYKRMLQMAPA
ncbi:MAG TPA: hypothetical protein VG735_09495 [Caulobacterales bacterium]|nr:hypothetical protein [Caulobacterales bacterium]